LTAFLNNCWLKGILCCLVFWAGFQVGTSLSQFPVSAAVQGDISSTGDSGSTGNVETQLCPAPAESQPGFLNPPVSLIAASAFPLKPRSAQDLLAAVGSVFGCYRCQAFGPHAVPVSGSPTLFLLGVLLRP
jgi:hypothetical protein